MSVQFDGEWRLSGGWITLWITALLCLAAFYIWAGFFLLAAKYLPCRLWLLPTISPIVFWAVKQDKSGNQEAKMVLIRLHLTINIKVFWKHWGSNENPLMNHSVFGKQREDTNNFIKGIQWVDICILFIWSLKLSGVWREFGFVFCLRWLKHDK